MTTAKTPIDWNEAQRICDLPAVDEAIRNLLADPTGDNATCMVRAILEASSNAWHDAVLNECMKVESCYVAADPAQTLANLINWHVAVERDKT